jgi:hypothetical protein
MKVGGAEYKISGIGPRTDAGRVGPRLTGCGSVQGGWFGSNHGSV